MLLHRYTSPQIHTLIKTLEIHSVIKIKMSDNIPFEIQAEIFKRLPVISLIQIRSVCKAWKFLIDSDDFMKNYSGQMQYLLARYKDNVDFQEKYVLFDDNHTFPQNRVSLNTHHMVNMLRNSYIIGSSHGLLCLYGDYQEGHDGPLSGTGRVVPLESLH
ncbi:putative F-box domain-containing protein [Helianthus annuus]|nr:putative F-box domain-containing protein [Helianthus annuus]